MIKKILLIFIFTVSLFVPFSYVQAFTILSSHKYAWSNNVGWINFAPVNSTVTVSDSALSGSAWSTNKGYIKLNPAQGGVSNDGTGNLSGSAWGEQLGYIDFNGVTINGSTGHFSGTAVGSLVGTITFDCAFCDVETDWRQTVTPPTPPTPPTPSAPPTGGGSTSGSVSNPPGLFFPDTGAPDLTEPHVISRPEVHVIATDEKLAPPPSSTKSIPTLPSTGDNISDTNQVPEIKTTVPGVSESQPYLYGGILLLVIITLVIIRYTFVKMK